MGLLDAVLGGLSGGGQGGGGGIQADLLRVAVGMLANGGGASGAASGGGGLGGLLGSALGGALGGGTAAGGGLADLMARFQQQGMGDVIGSWVSTGQNLPISPDQLGQVLGGDTLGRIASQLGLSPGEVSGQLSQLLPEVVDRLTPHGSVPAGGLGDIGTLLAKLSGGR
jgi:uncharacterized protein YidB (DUF937 family)